jgi:polyferredoxin
MGMLGAGQVASAATTANRFPRPEFSVRYVQPGTTTPSPREVFLEYVDVLVLVVAIAAASYFALRSRSRRGVLLVSVFSIIYFGFWRKGCVCPVGSVQNVVAALTDPGYAIPLTVLLFFLLPILAALLFGRTFCAAVCPLGAIQDLFAFRPKRIPEWLEGPLGLLPYAYLALAVLFVATGTGFIVCRYDPFIGFYRLDASLGMLLTGVAMLLIGVVVARPYCRFLCPYGVILNWASRFSWKHATISPTDCVKCRLCENACPFGAIEKPTPDKLPEPRVAGRRRLARLVLLLPVCIAAGGLAFALLASPLSRCHTTVALAERVAGEDSGAVKGTTLESEAFRSGGQSKADLFADAARVKRSFVAWGWLCGGFLGLATGLSLVGMASRRGRDEYTIDRGSCLSCARCFEYCPREHEELAKAAKEKANGRS